MRSDGLKREVEVSQDLATSAFTIRGNAKMFSILADKLYSDKPRAVVREIACNALDAHGMNGQTDPFIIAMPNHMEPMLTIRDFGPGMDDPTVMEVYTSFGASTKDQDDDSIGGFGLGCKSPFAYSDAFTVTSWFEGVKRSYAAYRGSDGVPQMSRVSEEPSDEPSGIEVRVPIKLDDWHVFEDTAQDVLAHFPQGSFTPVGFEVEASTYTADRGTYKVRDTSKGAKDIVLMGPVAYPLDWAIVLKGDTALPKSIVPTFNIGELDLLPSREGLSYDNQTLARLRQRYEEISSTIADRMFEEIQTLPRVQQLEYIANAETNGTWGFVRTRFQKEEPVMKDGQPVLDAQGEPKMAKSFDGFPGISDKIDLPGRPLTTVVEKARSGSTAVNPKIDVNSHRTTGERKTLKWSDLKDGNLVFVFDDLPDLTEGKKRQSSRFRLWLKESGYTKVTFITYDRTKIISKPGEHPLVYGYTGDVTSVDDIRPLLEGWSEEDNFVNLSEMPLPEQVARERATSAPREKTTLARVLYTKAKPSHGGLARDYHNGSPWSVAESNIQGGVYVPLNNYDLVDETDREWFKHHFATLPGRIYGLSKKALAQVKKDGNEADFVHLKDYIQEQYRLAVSDPRVAVEIARSKFIKDLEEDPRIKNILATVMNNPDLFPLISEEAKRVKIIDEDAARRISMLADYGVKHPDAKMPKTVRFKSDIVKRIEREMARSPLLRVAVSMRGMTNLLGWLSAEDEDVKALVKVSRKK